MQTGKASVYIDRRSALTGLIQTFSVQATPYSSVWAPRIKTRARMVGLAP